MGPRACRPVAPRHLRGYGLIEAPLSVCVKRLDGAFLDRRSQLRRRSGPRTGLLARRPALVSRKDTEGWLGHLTFPATRWALFAVGAQWTAVINNCRNGSEFADSTRFVSRLCSARTCRVVDYDPGPSRLANGYRVRAGHPACIFELFGIDGASQRSISAALDGDRWYFGVHGDPLPVEAAFDYSARRKRDRFTSDDLQQVLAHLGVEAPVAEVFHSTDEFVLIEEELRDREWAARVEAWSSTTEQEDKPGFGYLRRGLGFAEHMATHASSVVVDMTRAVLLSPELAPEVEPYLRAARNQLGRETFDHRAEFAQDSLRSRGG